MYEVTVAFCDDRQDFTEKCNKYDIRSGFLFLRTDRFDTYINMKEILTITIKLVNL